MKRTHRALTLAFLATALPFAMGAGCDEGDDPHGGADAGVDCTTETRDDDWGIGLTKQGTAITGEIMAADPAIPAKGDNTWTVALSDGTGPMAAAAFEVIPFMPDHGHGTPVTAEITESATTPGEYEVSKINLWMPGLWEVNLYFPTESAQTDRVVFKVCIDG